MIKSVTNNQNNFTNQRSAVSFQAFTQDKFYVSTQSNMSSEFCEYDANVTEHSTLLNNLSKRMYDKSQTILGKVSQSRYENAVKSLTNIMQELLQSLPKNSLSYDFADRLYERFLSQQDPKILAYEEIDAYNIKLTGGTELRTAKVQESKDNLINALESKNSNAINQALEQFQRSLQNYSLNLTSSVEQFFAIFENAFSQNQMEDIIENIASLYAYGKHNTYNITLTDGSSIAWGYDARGQMKILINGTDIMAFALNANALLAEIENFKTLLNMLEKKENTTDTKTNELSQTAFLSNFEDKSSANNNLLKTLLRDFDDKIF